MKIFECQNCSQLLYFENNLCERCGHAVGYAADAETILTLQPSGPDQWRPVKSSGDQKLYRFCGNAAQNVCNWLVPADAPGSLCEACQLNRLIPNLAVPDHLLLWRRLELAKHYLVYGLRRFGLPTVSKTVDPESGLAFDFVSDTGESDPSASDIAVTTGHNAGLITINLGEADDAERERRRKSLGEPYRTLVGHFRHEIGHYYWDRLVANNAAQAEFRSVFGDDRKDYGDALERHYAAGPSANWQDEFVSSYASAHPFEDFAETWAHYLHIVDTLETAQAFGLVVRPSTAQDVSLKMAANFDPYRQPDFSVLMKHWLPLTLAVNSLNRSMGQPDLYPFVLGPKINLKLDFIHRLIHRQQRSKTSETKLPETRGSRTWLGWLRKPS